MKDKNLLDDINSQSLDSLTQEADRIIKHLENTSNLENSIEEYQKLIKLNNLIQKKFQIISKKINNETKTKITKIIKKND
tara:strand:+ start:2519 stop:2758 length:240 start_codon:yes stop_codon:yes gene_type:complete